MLSLQFLCFMFNYCIFTILWEKHPLGDWTSSGCGVEPVCLIWVSIGGWWSQHRKNPCALQEEGTQLVLQQILAEGCFQFSPCPWISGGFEVTTSKLYLDPFQPFESESLPFLLLFRSKVISMLRQEPLRPPSQLSSASWPLSSILVILVPGVTTLFAWWFCSLCPRSSLEII